MIRALRAATAALTPFAFGPTSQRMKSRVPVLHLLQVATLSLLLAACGESALPNSSAARPDQPTPSGWSTLGNRAVAATAKTGASANASPAGIGTWQDYAPAERFATQNTSQQTIVMPDGIQLSAAVSLPADADGNSAQGRLPTLVTLTGYNKDLPGNTPVSAFLGRHGYAEVLVDVRGTGSSEGDWDMFGPIEQADYRPILDWVAAQPFCDGNIGLYGESLLGITAALAASKQHPAVKTAFLKVPMADAYRDIVFAGGQTSLSFIPAWFLLVMGGSTLNPQTLTDPVTGLPRTVGQLQHALTRQEVPLLLKALIGDSDTVYDNDFWSSRSPIEHAAQIKVPTFILGGLQDIFQRGEPLLYEAIKQHSPAKLLIGPWTHTTLGAGLPADGVPALERIALQWFDHYLRGMDSGADRLPNVTQYVHGLDHYLTSEDWPHPRASAKRLHLRGDQRLTEEEPAAEESSRTTIQYPLGGLCSASTVQWTAGLAGNLPLPCFTDNRFAETLELHYQTAPMTEDVYINGPILANLWVSTTARDSGLSVRVDDVTEADDIKPLTSGLQMVSARAMDDTRSRRLNGELLQPWLSYTSASAASVEPGEIVPVSVEIFPTSALIRTGHRLRISIGSSDFPRGLPPAPQLLSSAAGALTVYSDAEHRSNLVLPVVPADALNQPR